MQIGTCSGLHYAHEKVGLDGTPLGIVHRDVSPPNLILTYDGTINVVDFGIAKAATAKSNTAVGTLKGKIPYMAPEQCRSEPLDRRSDIFSIGIILYELTVGRRLFQAETEIAIIQKITSGGFPPPTSVHPSYPGELEAIVMRALQLNTDARYSTARDLQIDLEEFAREYKLAISSARLGRFMEELFDEDQRRMPVSTNLPPPEPLPPPAAPVAAPAAPATPPPAAPSSPDFEAFASALSKVLDDGGADPLTELTEEIGSQPEPPKVHGIDLDNLQLEELDPSKYDK